MYINTPPPSGKKESTYKTKKRKEKMKNEKGYNMSKIYTSGTSTVSVE
jgi:hypothetical protein